MSVGVLLLTVVTHVASGARAKSCPQNCNAGERKEVAESVRQGKVKLLAGCQRFLQHQDSDESPTHSGPQFLYRQNRAHAPFSEEMLKERVRS